MTTRPWSRWNRFDDPPIKIIESYLKSCAKDWTEHSAKVFRSRIYHFCRCLEDSNVELQDISLRDLLVYDDHLRQRGIVKSSFMQYRATINAFLRRLAAKGQLRVSLVDLKLEKIKFTWLSEHEKQIVQPHANKIHRIYGYEFYEWLNKNHLVIERVTKKEIKEYECHLRTMTPPRTVSARQVNMRIVHNHLRWLCARGNLKRSLAELGILKGRHPHFFPGADLPELALKFLNLMSAHKRPNTIASYKTRLGHFYKFLQAGQISIEDFTRLDFEEYMKSMQVSDYAPQTRRHGITAVQVYLSWLYECGFLKKDPEPVLRNFPRPKRSDYLPRNLLPEVDHLLQSHLEKSGHIVSLALLLMRRTGIRIGDLKNLPFDCVRADEESNSYLKVPIGKLHNERLVPLDKITLGILNQIKQKSLQYNSGQEPEFLIIHPRGRPPAGRDYQLVLYEIAEKLRLDSELSLGEESLVSHRLRHTYATTLLGAGMSIEGIKELLGHRSLTMSLRYAQVTPRKLRKDYLAALKQIEEDVEMPVIQHIQVDLSPNQPIDDLLASLRGKLKDHHPKTKQVSALIRRIERIRKDLIQIA